MNVNELCEKEVDQNDERLHNDDEDTAKEASVEHVDNIANGEIPSGTMNLPYIYPTTGDRPKEEETTEPDSATTQATSHGSSNEVVAEAEKKSHHLSSSGEGPSFKAQVHNVAPAIGHPTENRRQVQNETLPGDIPMAVADLVSPSQLRREQDGDEPDGRDEEIRRLENQVQLLQNGRQSETRSNKTMKTRMAYVLAFGILCSVALVAGICGTGKCSGPSEARPSASPTTSVVGATFLPTGIDLATPQPSSEESTNNQSNAARTLLIASAVNAATLSENFIAYPLPTNPSPEETALAWLIDLDPAYLAGSSSLSVQQRQRYVLACLWFQSIIPFAAPHSRTWLVDENECVWESIQCDNDGEITAIELEEDNVHGAIPEDVGLLTRLTKLHFSGNSMSGSLPTTLGLLTNLRFMDLSSNRFSGTIPTEVNRMIYMKEAWFYNNEFTGTMPFCSLNKTFSYMEADCNEVVCLCCTECCPNGGWGAIPGELLGRCDA